MPRSILRFLPALAIPVVFAARALPALAQDATAGPLFDKGVADMEAGHFDTACPAIAESQRLDPRPGTLFTLAECYAKGGKSSSAVARYQDYLDLFARMTPDQQSKQQGRDKTSQTQIDKITPDVPKLTLKLPSGAPAGTEVKRDGVVLGSASLGLALPVDPGDHVVTTQVPGGPVQTQTITLGKGEKKDVTLTIKAAEAGTSEGTPNPIGPGPAKPPAEGAPPPEGDASRGNGQRIAGIVVASVGVAGLIVGAVTGGLTLGQKDTITKNCSAATKTCNQTGFDAMNSAKATGAVSSAMFVIGGVATAAGIVVFFTAPKASSKAPHVGFSVGPSGGEMAVGGQF